MAKKAKKAPTREQVIKKKTQTLDTYINYTNAFTKTAAESSGLKQKFYMGMANVANTQATKAFDDLLYYKAPGLKPKKK